MRGCLRQVSRESSGSSLLFSLIDLALLHLVRLTEILHLTQELRGLHENKRLVNRVLAPLNLAGGT
ncbi:MAG: hypothetical protein HC936_11330 [Leptolyngbyaceae cyanobacterium SU_3_3]|nr:hypothetical protein [Leptolyngbyaceae cyanobacterium SU_3_3]NJR50326.1 hypothetical protein [Leptolyngbyaceae cyanobacterium CSU_1_3]